MNIPDEVVKKAYADFHATLGSGSTEPDFTHGFRVGALWARGEALREAEALAMKTGDERIEKATNEQERGRGLRPDQRKAQLADDHAWALRNQADGLWEAASAIRALAEI